MVKMIKAIWKKITQAYDAVVEFFDGPKDPPNNPPGSGNA